MHVHVDVCCVQVYLTAVFEQGTTEPDIPTSEYFEFGNNVMITYLAVSAKTLRLLKQSVLVLQSSG